MRQVTCWEVGTEELGEPVDIDSWWELLKIDFGMFAYNLGLAWDLLKQNIKSKLKRWFS